MRSYQRVWVSMSSWIKYGCWYYTQGVLGNIPIIAIPYSYMSYLHLFENVREMHTAGLKITLVWVEHRYPAVLNRIWRYFLLLICEEHKNMSRAFSGTVSPYFSFSHCRLSIVEYKTWSASCFDWHFVCFQFADDVRDACATKTANEIPAEGNCRQFSQGASVWAAWGAPFTWFVGLQWKRRRSDSGLFQIRPRGQPPARAFRNVFSLRIN